MLTNMLLGAILGAIVGAVAFSIAVFFRIKSALTEFITPPEPDKPSQLGLVTDAAASMLARAVVAQAKTTFMGVSSGAVRAEQAVKGDIALDLAGQNPLLGTILASFPHLGKTLKRNPQLIDIALNYLQSHANPGSNGQHQPVSSSPKFKL